MRFVYRVSVILLLLLLVACASTEITQSSTTDANNNPAQTKDLAEQKALSSDPAENPSAQRPSLAKEEMDQMKMDQMKLAAEKAMETATNNQEPAEPITPTPQNLDLVSASEQAIKPIAKTLTPDAAPLTNTQQDNLPEANLEPQQASQKATAASPEKSAQRTRVIMPNDALDIKVDNVAELSGSVRVNTKGEINVPLLGKVQTTGMTASALSAELERQYGAQYLQNPKITVTLLTTTAASSEQ